MRRSMVRHLISALLLVACLVTGPAAGQGPLEGVWHRTPYALLEDNGEILIAFQVSCYRYAEGTWLPPLDSREWDTPAYTGLPEKAVLDLLRQQGFDEPVLAVAKYVWGDLAFVLFGVGEDEQERVSEQIVLRRSGKGWAPLTEINLDDLFFMAVSGHLFVEKPWMREYPAANIEGLEVWERPGGDSDNPLRIYLRLSEERYRTLDEVSRSSPHLGRLIDLARTDDLGQFIDAYNTVLHPEVLSNFENTPEAYETFMKGLQQPGELRLLRELRGENRVVSFILYAGHNAAEGPLDVWPFILDGDWRLTTFLFPDDPARERRHLVVNSLIHTAPFREVVRELTMTGRPVVEFGTRDSVALEGSGTVELPVVLSWPAREAVSVSYAVTGGEATAGEDFELAPGRAEIRAGDLSTTVVVRLLDDRAREEEETVVVTLRGPSAAASLGSRSAITLRIVDDD